MSVFSPSDAEIKQQEDIFLTSLIANASRADLEDAIASCSDNVFNWIRNVEDSCSRGDYLMIAWKTYFRKEAERLAGKWAEEIEEIERAKAGYSVDTGD